MYSNYFKTIEPFNSDNKYDVVEQFAPVKLGRQYAINYDHQVGTPSPVVYEDFALSMLSTNAPTSPPSKCTCVGYMNKPCYDSVGNSYNIGETSYNTVTQNGKGFIAQENTGWNCPKMFPSVCRSCEIDPTEIQCNNYIDENNHVSRTGRGLPNPYNWQNMSKTGEGIFTTTDPYGDVWTNQEVDTAGSFAFKVNNQKYHYKSNNVSKERRKQCGYVPPSRNCNLNGNNYKVSMLFDGGYRLRIDPTQNYKLQLNNQNNDESVHFLLNYPKQADYTDVANFNTDTGNCVFTISNIIGGVLRTLKWNGLGDGVISAQSAAIDDYCRFYIIPIGNSKFVIQTKLPGKDGNKKYIGIDMILNQIIMTSDIQNAGQIIIQQM
jgi:hypothetical protein